MRVLVLAAVATAMFAVSSAHMCAVYPPQRGGVPVNLTEVREMVLAQGDVCCQDCFWRILYGLGPVLSLVLLRFNITSLIESIGLSRWADYCLSSAQQGAVPFCGPLIGVPVGFMRMLCVSCSRLPTLSVDTSLDRVVAFLRAPQLRTFSLVRRNPFG
jgi:hypothetical protein